MRQLQTYKAMPKQQSCGHAARFLPAFVQTLSAQKSLVKTLRYNPTISQFYGVDPLVEKYPAFNPYNYTLNNPVMLVDPDGRKWVHPEQAKKLSNRAKQKIKNRKKDIKKWETKLLKKGIKKSRIKNLNKKITAAKNRIKALNETIKNIELLGEDSNLYDFEKTEEQLHHVIKKNDGIIYI